MANKLMLLGLAGLGLYLYSKRSSTPITLNSGLVVNPVTLLSNEESANYSPAVKLITQQQRQAEITQATDASQPFVMGQFTAHPANYIYSGYDMAWIRPDLFNPNTNQQIWR